MNLNYLIEVKSLRQVLLWIHGSTQSPQPDLFVSYAPFRFAAFGAL